MNFLAHLHLGRHSEGFLLGSLLGDFIRGNITDDMFTREIREGIRLHRAIDAFTDQQEHWKHSRARLSQERRRFAGIIVDVFYDHFLSVHWKRFTPARSRVDFLEMSYAALLRKAHLVPGPEHKMTRAVLRRVSRERWLDDYHTTDGIARTLDRISLRSPRIRIIAGSSKELRAHYKSFEKDFLSFYPAAMQFARSFVRNA